jgi:hypothetical protein
MIKRYAQMARVVDGLTQAIGMLADSEGAV